MIFISRDGRQLGQFAQEEVARGLHDGRFLPTDLGWKEGMDTWKPLSTFGLAGAAPVPPLPSADQHPSAPTPLFPGGGALPPGAAAQAGLAWERPGEFFSRFLETTLGVLFSPVQTFREMKTRGEIKDPLLYLLVSFIIMFIASLINQIVLQAVLSGLGLERGEEAVNATFSLIFALVMSVVLIPLAVLITAFVGGAIFHVCLMLFGGAREGFMSTCRAVCYAGGALNIVHIIPLLGAVIAFFWGPVVYAIAFKEAHKTDLWRAVCAVLLPYLVCCGLTVLLLAAAFSLIWASFQKMGAG